MADLLRTALQQSLIENSLVGLYSNASDPDHFTVGWIVGLTAEDYVAATIDEVGRADGFRVGFVDDLFQVVTGGDYLEAVSRMIINHPVQELGHWPASDMEGTLAWAAEKREVVFLYHRGGIDVEGVVTGLDSTHLEVEAYASTGSYEGQHIFRKQDLMYLDFGGPEQTARASVITARAHDHA
jgi:hypothetical protein